MPDPLASAPRPVALVTGAGRGIGAAAVLALAQAGFAVVAAARRAEDARRVVEALPGGEAVAMAAALDVADPAAAPPVVAAALARWGRLDVLVNNAGVIEPIARIAEADPEAWARCLAVNLAGAFNMVHAVLPAMLAQGGGTILNLSSGAAFRPLEGWSAYCASKAGLAMLTRAIDLEYGAAGIRAVGISPGLVDTGMQGQIRASGVNPVSRTPRERLADPADPARLIVWLAGGGAAAHAGAEVDIRAPEIRRAAGLPPLPPAG